jgi:hypothetical protein
MLQVSSRAILNRLPSCKFVCSGIVLLACSIPLFADTSALLRRVTAGGCYCHCAEAHLKAGCVKLCDSKKYAQRAWATKCAKPHMQTPDKDSNAGPRFPHPGRAERAELQQQF